MSLDLEKAFDKVLHSSVFEGLVDAGVESDIVRVLLNLYSLQSAHVRLDGGIKSRAFMILCGVRQEDLLSPILFNSVKIENRLGRTARPRASWISPGL